MAAAALARRQPSTHGVPGGHLGQQRAGVGVAGTVGVDGRLREAGDVRRRAGDVDRTALRPVADDRDRVAAEHRGDRGGQCRKVVGRVLADGAEEVLGLLGVARPHVGHLEHGRPDVRLEAREGGAGVEHHDHVGVQRRQPREQRVAGAVEGEREAGDADQVTRARARRCRATRR